MAKQSKPNIERIAKEGANFTDRYGRQSCTAGRHASSRGSRRSVLGSPKSVSQWMKTLQEFPPRQKPGSFSVGDVMARLEQNTQALAAASK
jgi:hypothetical protein